MKNDKELSSSCINQPLLSNAAWQSTDYYMYSKYLRSQAPQTESTGWQGFEIIYVTYCYRTTRHPGMCSQSMHRLHTTQTINHITRI